MSLTLVRSLMLAGAIAASLFGAGLAHAEDEPPAEAPVEVAAAAPTDIGPEYADEMDTVYADAFGTSTASLESALTTVLSGCRTGLLSTRVAVIPNELDPLSGYVLVTEISEFGRSMQEKLTAGMLESCFKAMDTHVDKAMLDEALTTIETAMETLLKMA